MNKRSWAKRLAFRGVLLGSLLILPSHYLLEELTRSDTPGMPPTIPNETLRSLSLCGTTVSAETLASRAETDRETPVSVSIVAQEITGDLLPALASFNVRELHISCRRFSAPIPAQLSTFAGLEGLAVNGPGVTAWRQPLLAALPKCNLELADSRLPTFPADTASSLGSDTSIRAEAVDTMLTATSAIFALRIGGGDFSESLNPPQLPATMFHTPATVQFGTAMLGSYQATRTPCFLTCAMAVADELVATQLVTGGWEGNGEVDVNAAKTYGYRKLTSNSGHGTYLDYPHTFHVMRFLMALDLALRESDSMQENQRLREAIDYCLTTLVEKQYPNGAWPLWLKSVEPPDRRLVIARASIPDQWSKIRTTDGYGHYRYHYTINDNVTTNIIGLLLMADDVYDRGDCLRSAERGGDFLLLAQLPSPQRGWAQQYDWDMHPSWARSFEPPAVSGRESQVVINSLLRLYSRTGRRAYLRAAKEGIDYLQEQCKKSDDQFARFYELQTNRPLFISKRYMLTYKDKGLIEHYSMKAGDATPALAKYYHRLVNGTPEPPPRLAPVTEEVVRETIAALQETAAGENEQVTQMSHFCERLETLVRFVSQRNPSQELEHEATEHAANP